VIADAQALVLVVVGAVLTRLTVTDEFLTYLRPSMKLPLLAAGLVLTALGGFTFFGHRDAIEAEQDHTHGHAPRVGWLLLLPVCVLFLVVPAPLNADAARRSNRQVAPTRQSGYPPLRAATDGAVDLGLGAFLSRALYDSAGTLDGVTVRLTGFVARDTTGTASFVLRRFVITCCAADAYPIGVPILGATAAPAENTWVAITGSLRRDPTGTSPALDAASVTTIPQPDNPYE
jgi:uncharacterized repeat protein (TIGR03943 family)